MFTKKTLILNAFLSIIFMSIILFFFYLIIGFEMNIKDILETYILGLIIALLCSMIDIFRFKNLVKKVEKKTLEINEAKKYSEYVNETLPAGIFVTDENYIIKTWNREAEKITGYKKENVVGQDYFKIARTIFSKRGSMPSSEDYEKHGIIYREYLMNTIDNEFKFIKKNTKIIKKDSGESVGLIGSFFDITAQKSLEAELIDLHDKIGQYLDTAKIIFLILNRQNEITMINQEGARILGYEKKEMIGQKFINYVPEKIRARIKDMFEDLLDVEIDFADYYEHEVLKKDGKILMIGWNNSSIKNEFGKRTEILSVGVDLTDKKKVEELLKYQATMDDMTNLYNRRTGIEILKKHHSLSRRYHRIFSICYIDLNNLKNINDKIGHDAGDFYITKVSEIIKLTIRESDIACRLGGDEFLIIFPECDLNGSRLVISRIIKKIEEENKKNKIYHFSISYGFSEFNGNDPKDIYEKDIKKMVSEADKEMYKMKQKSK